MPKLNPKQAETVSTTDAWEAGSGRTLLEEGRYAAQLYSVVEREGNVAPVWNWRFVNIHDQEGEPQGRTNLFHSTSLSPKAAGGLRQTFDAFGYTANSDTDEMIGEWVVLYVTKEIQERGKNAGQLINVVKSLSPFVPDEWAFDADAVPEYVERDRGAGPGGSRSRDEDDEDDTF